MNDNDKQIAFMNLFEPVRANLSRFCRALSGNNEDAKDIMSETILQAYENFEKLKHIEAFKSYLFSIASRINKRKTWRSRLFVRLNDDHKVGYKVSSNAENNLDVETLYLMMKKLPDKQQEAIALYEISGFSIEEIKEIQGSSLSGVKSRLKRGREKLAGLLDDNLKNTLTKSNEISETKQKVYTINKQPEGKING